MSNIDLDELRHNISTHALKQQAELKNSVREEIIEHLQCFSREMYTDDGYTFELSASETINSSMRAFYDKIISEILKELDESNISIYINDNDYLVASYKIEN